MSVNSSEALLLFCLVDSVGKGRKGRKGRIGRRGGKLNAKPEVFTSESKKATLVMRKQYFNICNIRNLFFHDVMAF
jgi:hypothetical protein